MSEAEAVQLTTRPSTERSLVKDLHALGVREGMVLLCHSSLSRLGWVCGGAVAVIRALEAALGTEGTLVMPTHSVDLSDPSSWQLPPVPEEWWPEIRAQMPAFAADLTPVYKMGRIPECFRKQDGVRRSQHPQVSFAARGRHSNQITARHSLSMGLGEGSPLRQVYDLDGWVLLLGVGHDSSTSLHLAEHRASFAGRKMRQDGAPVTADGERRWVTFEDLEINSDDFVAAGDEFGRDTGLVRVGPVGCATSMLMRQRPLVDHAVRWFEKHRGV